MEVNEQKVLCITGMHRSGTSLVAMWLECCGIGFATEFLSGPRPFNKKGHFEDERLVALHSSVIEKELSKSKGWIVTKNIDFTFCESDLEKINEILKSYESISDIWAWKDPRTLFFLNSWKKIIPRLKILMIWRPADEVVSSLMRRDKGTKSETAKISLDEAIKTWQVYCEKIIEIKKAFPEDSLVVSIEDIIGQQDKVLTKIIEKFDISLERKNLEIVYSEKLLSRNEKIDMEMTPNINKITDHLNLLSALAED